jgi:hypothetical protein
MPGAPGRLSPPIPQPGIGEQDQVQTVVGARGAGAVLWTHYGAGGTNFNSQGHLLASDLNPSGGFTLGPVTGPTVDALDATAAYSPRDQSLVALWRTKTTNGSSVAVREFAASATRR